MFKLFDRYIFKEIFSPFAIGLLVSTFVLLMNQILVFFEMFISRGLSFRIDLKLLVYIIPSILTATVPMSVLIGVLAGLSRMSSDRETIALKTLGVGNKKILKPVLLFAFFGWMISSFLSLYLAPRANFKWSQAMSRSVLPKVQVRIKPREFREFLSDSVIFFQDSTLEQEWIDVFLNFNDSKDESRIIFAKEGRLNFYDKEKRAVLELFNGSIHSVSLSDPDVYKLMVFEHFEEELDLDTILSSSPDKKQIREKTVNELFRDLNRIKSRIEDPPEDDLDQSLERRKRRYISRCIEIHKRYALPFSCFIFAFLGLSLGVSTKKRGRTSGFTISLAIILGYYILITIGTQMAMEGKIFPSIGIWGPNILFFFLGIFFFYKSEKEFSFISRLFPLFAKKRKKDPLTKKKKNLRDQKRFNLRFPNILDRYILRKYLTIFSLVFFGILSIIVIVTFFERIDNIYEHGKPLSMLIKFIVYKIPEFIFSLLPVAALSSTLLCLGLLAKFNEITAMKTCGISLYRIILPVLFMAVFMSLFSFYLQENVLPFANKKADEVWKRISDKQIKTYNRFDRNWVLGIRGNRLYSYEYFDPYTATFNRISIIEIDLSTWTIRNRIYAERGHFVGEDLFLVDSWSRDFERNTQVSFVKEKEKKIKMEEDREYFFKEIKTPDQMRFNELRQHINMVQKSGFNSVKLKVDLHFKISFPFICFIMTLLGIPFAFSMGKRGVLVGFGLSIVIAIFYWISVGFFRSLGYISYLNPFLAAWGPNLVFGLFALYLIFTLRT